MKSIFKNLSKKNEKILFVSYFLGVRGNCPAEWGDDKLKVLDSLNRKLIIITSLQSKVNPSKNFIVFRVPSLSFSNFKYELNIYRKNSNGKFPILLKIFYVISFIFGSIFDFLMIKFVKNTQGHWSWFFISLPISIYILFRHNISKIFSTAGPQVAHLLSSILAYLFSIKLICEFQDPHTGDFILNPRSKRIAYWLDKFYKKIASKIIFVTKKAALDSKKISSKKYQNKIKSIYPGSWKFIKNRENSRFNENKNIEFIHLGTLYSSRNLDNLFIALDKFKRNNIKNKKVQSIKIINCGEIYLNNIKSYLKRKDFKLIKGKSRIEGLKRASKSSILLLVQHNDWRSEGTIPYKFYDYLNLRMPILAITKSKELDRLILKSGGISAKADSIDSIYESFEKLFNNSYQFKPESNNYLEFNIQKQLLKAID